MALLHPPAPSLEELEPRLATRHASAPGALVDERAARASLRHQIARLEAELAAAVASRFPIGPVREAAPRAGGRPGAPRLLDLGELERARDELVDRLARVRRAIAERVDAEEANRLVLERMLLEPERHPFEVMPLRDLGDRGCGAYRVRPRLGLIGMLRGWWQVKLSSGCPLPGGR